MSTLTHRLGLEFDLTSPEDRLPAHKHGIETRILKKSGVIFAEFSKKLPDVVVVEYDPSITRPDEICKKVTRLNGGLKKKVFL